MHWLRVEKKYNTRKQEITFGMKGNVSQTVISMHDPKSFQVELEDELGSDGEQQPADSLTCSLSLSLFLDMSCRDHLLTRCHRVPSASTRSRILRNSYNHSYFIPRAGDSRQNGPSTSREGK